MHVTAGELVAGRYLRRALLGKGGSGEVWRCRDLVLEREVALKRIDRTGPGASTEADQLFYKEAAALASLEHDNLVRAHDVGLLPDGSRYLVLEYVEGISLGAVGRRQGVLPWDLLGAVACQILAGLAHMHARGILHRDLKPDNVLLSEAPGGGLRVSVVDFGLATLQDPSLNDFRMDELAEVPEGAGVFLTPPYAAPEQIQRHPQLLGPATDLHALGVMLHEYCCGELPYRGATLEDQLRLVLLAAPDPFHPTNGAPERVGEIVARLLAKQPWRRYEFAAEVRRAFDGLWDPASAATAWHELRASWPEGEVRRGTGPVAPVESTDGSDTTLELAASSAASTNKGPRAAEPATELGLAPPALLPLQVPPLRGRKREQEELWAEVCRVLAGERRMILLYGEAGVGKSRLAHWLAEQVHERGCMVTLRASFGRTRGTMQGVTGALERYLGLGPMGGPAIEQMLGRRWGTDPASRELAGDLAALLRPLPAGAAAKTSPRPQLDRPEARVQVLLQAISRLVEGRPLLFWFDDLGRASPEEQTLVEELLRRPEPVLVVATVRHAGLLEARPPAPLESFGHRPDAHCVPVEPLDPSGLHHLLEGVMPLEAGVGRALHLASRGNPLFALQQLRTWSEGHQLGWDAAHHCYRVDEQVLARPAASARSLWASRIAALPEEAQLGALAATTLGSTFARDLFYALLSALALDADRVVLTLVQHQLLVPDRETLGFYHDLLEEHLVDELRGRADARRIYLAAAEALGAHPLGRTNALVRLAVQNLLAAEEPRRAAETLMAFLPEEWRTRRDPLQVMESLRLLEGQLDPEFEADWWRWKAEAEIIRSRDTEAEVAARAALAAYERRGDQPGAATALRLLGEVANARCDYVEAERAIGQALEACRALEDYEGQIRALLCLTRVYYSQSRLAEAESVTQEALAIVDGMGGLVLPEPWLFMGFIKMAEARYADARVWQERAIEAFRAQGEEFGEGESLFLRGWVALQQEDLAEADRCHPEALRHFRRVDEWWWMNVCLLLEGWVHCHRGAAEPALALGEQVHRSFVEGNLAHETGQALLLIAGAHQIAGREREAETALDALAALERPEPMVMQPYHLLRADHARRTGRSHDAERAVEAALESHRALGLTSFAVPWALRRAVTHLWPEELATELRSWLASLKA
ncbi:MAG: protein kinase [Deltaproteobacteria bacterium]|nr:protein kinase [Deltaproteobacteria bacterium]